MAENLMILHGGGPTAVINASLYGAVQEAKARLGDGRIYGARRGTGGLLRREILDLGAVPEAELELLPHTPGSAIGTSRDVLQPEDYAAMAEILQELGVRYVLMNGGNGTMDACGKLCAACRGKGIAVVGIPKTMDNDICATDHAPGYGSAARYMAASAAEVCADVRGLSQRVVVIEAMGRSAGWVAAAAALAAQSGRGPDLIYLPEVPFSRERYLEDVERLYRTQGSVVVMVSEGVDVEGAAAGAPKGRALYSGGVGTYLANLAKQELGCRARDERPGLLGRASIAWQSPVDRAEAELAGREAVRAALAGESGRMVAFRRLSDDPYRVEPYLVPVEEVMLKEKKLPPEFINERGNGVTPAFLRWCAPLIGPQLPRLVSFL